MIPSLSNNEPASAVVFRHSQLPEMIDPKSFPTSKPPFSLFKSLPYVHSLSLLLPEELWILAKSKITENPWILSYSKVNMSLLEIISGDFFNHYIKSSNILMVSEGRQHIDNRFSLSHGVLRLELDKPTYERCGLVGKPVQGLGRKHVKQRYVVELNLRLPAMLHGKKGFNRIVWAFTNVLDSSLTWLFVDLNPQPGKTPIEPHHPQTFSVNPSVTESDGVVPPLLSSADDLQDAEYQEQLLEWLSLAMLSSPRIHASDNIDPYLARYHLPDAWTESDASHRKGKRVIKLTWNGLITSKFVTNIFMLTKAMQGKHWLALSAHSFDGQSYAVIAQDERQILSWECA